MQYNHLPIYKASLDFCVYIELIVKNFDKYTKYSIGEDMRVYSKAMLFSIHRANRAQDKRKYLEILIDKCEENKMLIALAKELKVFKSFKQFEHTTKLCVGVCKQAQAWYNSMNNNNFARVLK